MSDTPDEHTEPFNWGMKPESPSSEPATPEEPKIPWWGSKSAAEDDSEDAAEQAGSGADGDESAGNLAAHPEPEDFAPPAQSLSDLVRDPLVLESPVDAPSWGAPVDPADAPAPIFGSSGTFTPAEPPARSEPEIAEQLLDASSSNEPIDAMQAPFLGGATVPTVANLTQSGAAPRIPAGAAGFAGVGAEPANRTKPKPRLLPWVTGGLLALVVVVALFFFGTQLPGWLTTNTASTPTPSVTPTAALAPGTYVWDQLYGGECIDPFSSPWQQEFTVVDCDNAHAAQLVYRGSFGGDASTAFPGQDALGEQINSLCTRSGTFDSTAASAYSNLQVQGAYPVTEAQWNSGQRSYFCFVNRADGSSITGSLQGSGPAG